MEIISIKNLNFSYAKNSFVFSNFNMHFSTGEIILIHGASGKGKSTLASLLAGHLKAESGEIFLKGSAIRGPSRDVIVVHQENDLFPWLTVQGHLDFLKTTGLIDKSENFQELLKKFKLHDALALYPHQLSGGMKRRLAILRGIFLKPEILILDESLSSIDDSLKVEVMAELKNFIKKENMTLVVIDHNSKSIDHFFDRRIEL